METKTKEILLEAAMKIGKRICSQAIWHDSKCTWEVTTPDMSTPKLRKGIKTLAGSTIYQGTSGIAIFLSELYRITQDDSFLNTANGAIKFALNEAHNLPKNSFGFHSGRTGIGYSAFLLSYYSQNENLMKEALSIIYEMKGHEAEDRGTDVIGGAGGAIQPLLKLYEFTNDQTLLDMAVNLGESLIKKANMETHGWSWGGSNSNYRNLCGYAHGTSGIGHAFLELYNQTNSDYYLYAAEQAFLYERQFYNSENNNWPDFRYTELSEYTAYNRIEELKEALRNNELPPFQIHYMSAWCHGAPGIGLSRLRGYKLSGNDTYKKECIAACADTIKSLSQPYGNYSLCHGFLGNAETLLIASTILHNNEYLNIIINKTIEGIENFENKNLPWPCGTMNSVSDPSLMLGEAGIGHFLLRIFDEETISVLSTYSEKKKELSLLSKNVKDLQSIYLNKYFSEIISIISRIEEKNVIEVNSIFGIYHSDIETAFELIQQYVNLKDEKTRKILEELFLLEKEKYFSSKNLTDYTKEYLDKISINLPSQFIWNSKILSLESSYKLITLHYNSDNLMDSINVPMNNIQEEENYYCLYSLENKIIIKKIDSFLFLLLTALQNEIDYESLIRHMLDVFEIPEDKIDLLKEKIVTQLFLLYKSGAIKVNERTSALV